MIYIFFSLMMVLYLSFIDRYLINKKSFFLFIPFIVFYCIIPSIQYDIGSDYFSYYNIYYNPDELKRFYDRNEVVFYGLYWVIKEFNLGPQSIFFFSSVIIGVFLSVILFKLRQYGYNVALLFFIFMVVTNIYHNQMNGLRQYVSIIVLPLIFLLFFERRFLLALLLGCFSFLTHNSAFLSFLIAFLIILKDQSYKKLFLLFCIIPFVYYFSVDFFVYVIDSFLPQYKHYLFSSYGEALSVSATFSKLYYLPIFMLFWFEVISNEKSVSSSLRESNEYGLLKYAIIIWLFTYWIFVLYVQFAFFFRVASYFFFFYIFPLYYLIDSYYRKRRLFFVFLILIYLFAPYFFKTIISPVEVFQFKTFIL